MKTPRLVLTRKLSEAIQIGDSITVTVVGFAGRKVKLGIVAPKNVKILRSELKKEG